MNNLLNVIPHALGGRFSAAVFVLGLSASCGHLGVDLEGNKDALEKLDNKSDASFHEHEGDRDSGKLPPTKPIGKPVVVKPAPKSDASVVEPGLDASLPTEPALDAGPPQEPTLDAGQPMHGSDASVQQDGGSNPPADPVLTCEPEQQCALQCSARECSAQCDEVSFCTVWAGESPVVKLDCASSATCKAKGASGPQVRFECSGAGDCYAYCGAAEQCRMDCLGAGTCELYCEDADSCKVECKEGGKCFVHRSDPDTSVVLECAIGLRQECAQGLLACHADCPTAPQPLP
ncbi:MAG: hypothetical protein RJA70_2873 [Pseudomonadota bacterium]